MRLDLLIEKYLGQNCTIDKLESPQTEIQSIKFFPRWKKAGRKILCTYRERMRFTASRIL